MKIYRSIVALLIVFSPSLSLACSCAASTISDLAESANIIFVARITSAAEVFTEDRGGIQAKYQVIETLKGAPEELDVLATGYWDGDCGVPLRVGHYVLVLTNDSGWVGLCSGSEPLGVGFGQFYKERSDVYKSVQSALQVGSEK
jgi:hypothetical protein